MVTKDFRKECETLLKIVESLQKENTNLRKSNETGIDLINILNRYIDRNAPKQKTDKEIAQETTIQSFFFILAVIGGMCITFGLLNMVI